jgi:ArsR family transcriptional regulator
MDAAERARIFKALGDPRRVDIVDRLSRDGSLCGTELAESLNISLALLCHHWEILVDAGVLRKERVGQRRVCSVDLERIREATGGWEAGRKRRARRRP